MIEYTEPRYKVMIIDCHTRIWASPAQLGTRAADWLLRNGGNKSLSADPGELIAASDTVSKFLVWGFRSKYLQGDVPNAFLIDFVKRHPDKVLAVAAVDPTESDATERLSNIADCEEFIGITISPAAQGFHPADTRAMKIYQFCADHNLPVFIEIVSDLTPKTVMEFARPVLLDEIARTFPTLKIIIASMGYPWIDETIVLLEKQPMVLADIAALLRKGWVAYEALLKAYQAGVTNKLLFGSDFPFSTPAEAIERLYRLNEFTRGTSLPVIPREALRSILEQDALRRLGIHRVSNNSHSD